MLPGLIPIFNLTKASQIIAAPPTALSGVPSITFTAIPATIKKIDFSLWSATASADDSLRFRLGSGGTIQATGYDSLGLDAVPTNILQGSVVGFDGPVVWRAAGAAVEADVRALLTLLDPTTNTWVLTAFWNLGVKFSCYIAGSVSLAAALERIQVGAITANVTGTASYLADPSPQLLAPLALSGTSVVLTGIPASAKQIVVSLSLAQFAAGDALRVRLGSGGAVQATGYDSQALDIQVTQTLLSSTTGFDGVAYGAAASLNGHVVLTLANPATNTWVVSELMGWRANQHMMTVQGRVALSGPLDRVQLSGVSGAAFTAGKAGCMVLS